MPYPSLNLTITLGLQLMVKTPYWVMSEFYDWDFTLLKQIILYIKHLTIHRCWNITQISQNNLNSSLT